jgi:nicotinamidase-related amidase
MLLQRANSLLLIVDVQERLAPAVLESKPLIGNCTKLMRAANHLGIPVLISEQYPKGLGHTVPALTELVPSHVFVEKTAFSCASEPALLERIGSAGRVQIVLAGMETHVCVLQSAFDLVRKDYIPYVVQDAVSSRTHQNHDAGIERLRSAGIPVVTTEMVIFEWLERADTAQFRALRSLIV